MDAGAPLSRPQPAARPILQSAW